MELYICLIITKNFFFSLVYFSSLLYSYQTIYLHVNMSSTIILKNLRLSRYNTLTMIYGSSFLTPSNFQPQPLTFSLRKSAVFFSFLEKILMTPSPIVSIAGRSNYVPLAARLIMSQLSHQLFCEAFSCGQEIRS